jgi:RAT1-interacting protein
MDGSQPNRLSLSSRIKSSLKQPREITSFSIDINNKVQLSDGSLKYFYFPENLLDKQIDLCGGFKDFIEKDESTPQHLNELLKAIKGYEEKHGENVSADIITWRGIMTKLLCLPYNNNDDIDLNIEFFDGHIFMEEDHKLKMSKQRHMNERDKLMCYWGYKFESAATINQPWSQTSREEIETRLKRPVNNIEQYCSVVKTGIGNLRIVLGGEVDCVKDYKPTDGRNTLPHYLELKTSSTIRSDFDARKFENKIFKAWAQSFLLGVPTIIYGFRDKNGIVRSLEEFKTEEIPAIVKKSDLTPSNQKWNGMDAIGFYAAILDWIKNTVGTDENVKWRLQYHRNSEEVQLFRLPGGEDFLLDEFRQWRLSKRPN